MIDQYFGTKELYEVVLRAKTPMQFGSRYIEADEPVLYFENISMALISEKNSTIMARGGWANMPRVIWEDRSEVSFTMSEGVMSSISMSILLSANVTDEKKTEPMLISKRDGPLTLIPKTVTELNENGEEEQLERYVLKLSHQPVYYPTKKLFIFEYARDVVQKKMYGKQLGLRTKDGETEFCLGINDDNIRYVDDFGDIYLAVFKDKNLKQNADTNKEYLVDYYYEYRKEALFYAVQKERFNGLFTLEGKFYSKDENEGKNYTNILYMPKVRIVSDINLRLGERADPTVSVFNIIGLPETTTDRKNMILEITRLDEDLDEDVI